MWLLLLLRRLFHFAEKHPIDFQVYGMRCETPFNSLRFFFFLSNVCNSSKIVETWKRSVFLRKPSGNMRKYKKMRCTSYYTAERYTYTGGESEYESSYHYIGKSSNFIVFLRSFLVFFAYCCSFVCRIHPSDEIPPPQMIRWSSLPIFHSHNVTIFVFHFRMNSDDGVREELLLLLLLRFVCHTGDNTF